MAQSRKRAERRTKNAEDWIRETTGDADWTTTCLNIPRSGRDFHYITIRHPGLAEGLDRSVLRETSDFDENDQLKPEPRAAIAEVARRISWRTQMLERDGMERIWAHPLAIALLLPLNNGDRSLIPNDVNGRMVDLSGGTLVDSDIQLNVDGTRWLSTKTWETTLVIEQVPRAISAGMAGRRLSTVMTIAETGYGDVDRAVSDLVVDHAATGIECTTITFRPVDWLVYGGGDRPVYDRPYLAANMFTLLGEDP